MIIIEYPLPLAVCAAVGNHKRPYLQMGFILTVIGSEIIATVIASHVRDGSCVHRLHLKPKSREISFAHKSFISHLIVLKFCSEHGSDTSVLCAKFQTDWTIGMEVMDERRFARFQLKISFGRISYIAQQPYPGMDAGIWRFNCHYDVCHHGDSMLYMAYITITGLVLLRFFSDMCSMLQELVPYFQNDKPLLKKMSSNCH